LYVAQLQHCASWEGGRVKTDFGKLLLDKSPDAVLAASPAGTALYSNKGAEAGAPRPIADVRRR
jgi:hypothetical protein